MSFSRGDYGYNEKTASAGARYPHAVFHIEEVLQRVAYEPSSSTRYITEDMNTSIASVWRVLHEQQLYPYHFQKVQGLSAADYHRRVQFCLWLLHQIAAQPNFLRYVLWTDEASFTRDGIFNSRNGHVWDKENPCAIFPRKHQQPSSVNVWAGIVDDYLIWPYLLPERLTGPIYRRFLGEVLPELLENVPLNVRQQMWFQHDGAPAHFAVQVRAYLAQRFGHRWIARGGAVSWPPRSPDLSSLDFFLWGHVKSLVYETPVETEQDLIGRITAAFEITQNEYQMFSQVRRNHVRRLNRCIHVGGRHFEQLL
ncbi:unnamed protein product [Acanthoscelides obtectus]|uniref:Transposase n=1 Tax=Acanthoscelides obtectus TaxID=200917 RepID=A0A9P0NV71_ACAOB|nr:unnamed protein product [Acanthoscelides obtectus]CAK1621150.1 hypothetical protein AOBTE_LOCUS791 [Acanthoscelides obtectus]